MQDIKYADIPFYSVWKTQLYKGLAELALLSLLRQEARYGLELLQALREDAKMDVAEGSIYPMLHRLEKAGHIVADWRLEANAPHPRKYYTLTLAGQATLKAMTREWADLAANLHTLIRNSEP